MVECTLNHVAIDVDDVEETAEFYMAVFDMEWAPTPDFGAPYAWLEFGDQQLHLIERDSPVHPNDHFALIVDEFETVWDRAVEHGAISDEKGYIRAIPNGVVQCYMRDPSGNRVEFMWPDVDTLPEYIKDEVDYVDAVAPTDEPAGATIAANVAMYHDSE